MHHKGSDRYFPMINRFINPFINETMDTPQWSTIASTSCNAAVKGSSNFIIGRVNSLEVISHRWWWKRLFFPIHAWVFLIDERFSEPLFSRWLVSNMVLMLTFSCMENGWIRVNQCLKRVFYTLHFHLPFNGWLFSDFFYSVIVIAVLLKRSALVHH